MICDRCRSFAGFEGDKVRCRSFELVWDKFVQECIYLRDIPKWTCPKMIPGSDDKSEKRRKR